MEYYFRFKTILDEPDDDGNVGVIYDGSDEERAADLAFKLGGYVSVEKYELRLLTRSIDHDFRREAALSTRE